MTPEEHKYKVVRVEWKDAKSSDRLQQSELSESLELAPYVAVGFNIAEGTEALVICEGILPPLNKDEETIFKAVLTIPKALIVKQEELQVKP